MTTYGQWMYRCRAALPPESIGEDVGWATQPARGDMEKLKPFVLPGIEFRPFSHPTCGQSLSLAVHFIDHNERLCGQAARVPGHRSRGLGCPGVYSASNRNDYQK
jgi:hypothetical protein